MIRVTFGQATDCGKIRPINEDSLGARVPDDPGQIESKGHLFVVADGLGGHHAGEVASAAAVASLLDAYYAPASPSKVEASLRQAMLEANAQVYGLAANRGHGSRGMETTLTALALAQQQAYVAHVGDSRVYRWRAGRLSQLTQDHSEVAQMVQMGLITSEQARNHPRRHLISRTLGGQLALRPDFLRQPVAAGDRFLLCTDGLWACVADAELGQIVAQAPPADACARLVALANARGGEDNITVQVVRVDEVGETVRERERRLHGVLRWLGLRAEEQEAEDHRR